MIDKNDQSPYHFIFDNGESRFIENTAPIWQANSSSMWINAETREKVLELIYIINQIGFSGENTESYLIRQGKEHYWKIAELRDELEFLVQKDLLELYDFSKIKTTVEPMEKKRKQLIFVPND